MKQIYVVFAQLCLGETWEKRPRTVAAFANRADAEALMERLTKYQARLHGADQSYISLEPVDLEEGENVHA